jgi:hypothetical protein
MTQFPSQPPRYSVGRLGASGLPALIYKVVWLFHTDFLRGKVVGRWPVPLGYRKCPSAKNRHRTKQLQRHLISVEFLMSSPVIKLFEFPWSSTAATIL